MKAKGLDGLKLMLAVLFIVCLLDMPYGFYQLVRVVGLVGFILFTIQSYKEDNQLLAIVWLCSAVLINPFYKISLGRDIWNMVDIAWSLLLVFIYWREKKAKS